jgi:hypothetical protein
MAQVEANGFAVCTFCDRNMGTALGCSHQSYRIGGRLYKRVPVLGVAVCYDCNARIGRLHHVGCDEERCPKCGLQAISCNCDYEG